MAPLISKVYHLYIYITYDRYFLPGIHNKIAFETQYLKLPLILKSRTNNHLKINEFNSLTDKFITILGGDGGTA